MDIKTSQRDPIKQLHDKLQNDFWNYSAEYANHNGYRKTKQVTPEMRKKIAILKETIEKLESL